jgi:hypothetical protein
MGAILKILNLGELYQQTRNPIFINDLGVLTVEEREKFDQMIMLTCHGDVMSDEPACTCRHLSGWHLYDEDLAEQEVCDRCHDPVELYSTTSLENKLWFRAPQGVELLINPALFWMITDNFRKQGFSVIEYLINPNYNIRNVPKTLERDLAFAKQLVEKYCEGYRSYNAFIKNFFQILQELFNHRPKTPTMIDLWLVIEDCRKTDRIFTPYIPLPNRAILIQEKPVGQHGPSKTYFDDTLVGALDVFRTMGGIDREVCDVRPRAKEARTARALIMLGSFYTEFFGKFLASKPGVIRRSCLGSRNGHSFRNVIVGRAHNIRHDEVHIPWVSAVGVFRQHLYGIFIRRGLSWSTIEAMFQVASSPPLPGNQFHEMAFREFNLAFDFLLADSHWPGEIPMWLNRNPTLPRGSIELFWITCIKRDPSDLTMGVPSNNARGFNFDYDGDQMTGILLLSVETTDAMRPLSPHMSFFDMSGPRQLSNSIDHPSTVVLNATNWYLDKRDNQPPTLEQVNFLKELQC